MLEIIFTISSGVDVQRATIVSQITKSDILNFLAKEDDHSISISAHLTKKTNQIMNSI
jgi:hypothetical protein